MIRIAAAEVTARFEYVADFIFRQVLKTEYCMVKSGETGCSDGAVLYYGLGPKGAAHRVEATGICGDTKLPEVLPAPVDVDGIPVIYPAEDSDAFSFDVFSAVFFCLSRAEEFIIKERDEHGRFTSASSIFAPWVEQPYADRWIFLFGKWLVERGLLESLPVTERRWINTVDIDIAFAFKGRGLIRNMGATVRDLLKLQFRRTALRFSVFAGRRPDPYDTYAIVENEGDAAAETICFVLSGERGGYDINLDPGHSKMRGLILRLKKFAEVGIHPSYAAHEDRDTTQNEIDKLTTAAGERPRSSRFHFLRFSLPASFRLLTECGIKRDYSMGYADAVGFRSGTARPHTFFDLQHNAILPVEVVQLHAMDSAMNHYMHLTPDEAGEKLKVLYDTVEETGGDFVTVWHNHSLSETEEWQHWRKVYTDFAQYVRQKV
ncbi:MAG: polysaccharide deacetylase family protein [Cryomorphaceae bacterium]